MGFCYKQIVLPPKVRADIALELQQLQPVLKETGKKHPKPDRDVLLRIRSRGKALIDRIDPFWNGSARSLAYHWYMAEDCGFTDEELQSYAEILRYLSLFGKARITWETEADDSYEVADVPEEILDVFREAMPRLEEMRRGRITRTEYRFIRSFLYYIEFIDVHFSGELPKEVPGGISVAQRWAAADPEFMDFCSISDEEYGETFELYYTVLLSILAYGKAKVIRDKTAPMRPSLIRHEMVTRTCTEETNHDG